MPASVSIPHDLRYKSAPFRLQIVELIDEVGALMRGGVDVDLNAVYADHAARLCNSIGTDKPQHLAVAAFRLERVIDRFGTRYPHPRFWWGEGVGEMFGIYAREMPDGSTVFIPLW